MVDPVKDGEQERSIPDVWRPALAAIVDSIARGDAVVAADMPEVEVDSDFSRDWRDAVEHYGAVTLMALPEQTWETSVCLWEGEHWNCLVDLWTEEEGHSDLVLDVNVFEDGPGYRYELHLVYVP